MKQEGHSPRWLCALKEQLCSDLLGTLLNNLEVFVAIQSSLARCNPSCQKLLCCPKVNTVFQAVWNLQLEFKVTSYFFLRLLHLRNFSETSFPHLCPPLPRKATDWLCAFQQTSSEQLLLNSREMKVE